MALMDNRHDASREVRKLANPFRQGERVFIPTQSPYRSTDSSIPAVQYAEEEQTIEVLSVVAPYIEDIRDGEVITGDGTIDTVDNQGIWREFIITPELLEVNAKNTETVVLHRVQGV